MASYHIHHTPSYHTPPPLTLFPPSLLSLPFTPSLTPSHPPLSLIPAAIAAAEAAAAKNSKYVKIDEFVYEKRLLPEEQADRAGELAVMVGGY